MTVNTPKNDRFLKALARQPVDVTPVWMMRQAGRYLPEYRKVRAQVGGFMDLCRSPELAAEVTMQPLRRYDLDAAILFSDILTIPDAMGLGLSFVEGKGPQFARTVRDQEAVKALPFPDIESDLGYVTDAVKEILHQLDNRLPLIGFSGSPWTLATYMVEGGPSKEFKHIKTLLWNEPQTMHMLLDKLAQVVTDYLLAQIKAGVHAVQIFDTWGGILTPRFYQAFSLDYMQRIVKALLAKMDNPVPVILFSKNAGLQLNAMADTGCHALGLDWTMDIGKARQWVGDRVALQGNMDPATLAAKPSAIKEEITHILAAYGEGSGHIFNLGHGITPDINPEHVEVFINTVHEASRPYHQLS